MTNRIKCGKCTCEYTPTPVNNIQLKAGKPLMDNSCPQCGFGKMLEAHNIPEGKTILKDHKRW